MENKLYDSTAGLLHTGANALKLLKWILPPKIGERNLEYIIEDLPSADFKELASEDRG